MEEDRATVKRVAAASVRPIRERVLWPGRPEMCALDEDEHPNAIHLGAILGEAQQQQQQEEQQPEEEQLVVGAVSLFLSSTSKVAKFRKLAVDEEWRSAGIGTALVEVAAAEARCAGATILACDARRPQAPFYQRLGFELDGEPFEKYEGGGEYVRMQLALE